MLAAKRDARGLVVPKEAYCAPGYWVAVAAHGRKVGLHFEQLDLPQDRKGYAEAIALGPALGDQETYEHNRVNQGVNYSPLVVLEDADATNRATKDINGCIRSLFPDDELKDFVYDLTDVVGDMHDNVWSHAESAGVSMAQKWNRPWWQKGYCLEFALADCGRGMLGELVRSGVARRQTIDTHGAAIQWCVQQGNSSKLSTEDEWAQRLPEDAIGNPIGPAGRHMSDGNHHLGLGLYKLTELVRRYRGQLWLASGDSLLSINGKGQQSVTAIPYPWNGVVMACRFDTESVRRALQKGGDSPGDEFERTLTAAMGRNNE